jgi:peptidoglycan/LPS O-acetylase OafA/YrhL
MIVAFAARIAVVASGYGGSPTAVYPLTPARMDGLALGALLAVAAREPGGLTIFRRWARIVAPLAFGVLAFVFVPLDQHGSESWLFHTFGLTASVYLAGSLVVGALFAKQDGFWRTILGSRPLGQIGLYSYAIYVIHLPLAYLLENSRLVTRAWFESVIRAPLAAELLHCGTLMLVSIGFGALSWHLFERPILSWRRYLPYDRSATATPGAAVVDFGGHRGQERRQGPPVPNQT